MHGSELKIKILDGRNLGSSDSVYKLSPSLILEVGNQRQTTKIAPYQDSPVWNESFTFEILTGQEKLKVTLCDNGKPIPGRVIEATIHDLMAPNNFERSLTKDESTIDIDQDRKSKRFMIPGGDDPTAQINFYFTWVYSSRKLLNDYKYNFEKVIEFEEDRIEDLQGSLKNLEYPGQKTLESEGFLQQPTDLEVWAANMISFNEQDTHEKTNLLGSQEAEAYRFWPTFWC